MNRRQWMMLTGAALVVEETAQAQQSQEAKQPDTPDNFLLKDYRPESIYRIPETEVKKAKFPVIDVHCHGARPPQQVEDMVKLMDSAGVENTVIFTPGPHPKRPFSASPPSAVFLVNGAGWRQFHGRLHGDAEGTGYNSILAFWGRKTTCPKLETPPLKGLRARWAMPCRNSAPRMRPA